VSGWAKGHLEKQVQDLELKRQLKPTFTFGCKRVLGHNEYYPALQMPHVTVHTDKIQEIVGNTIISEDGTKVKLEVSTGRLEYLYKKNFILFSPGSYFGYRISNPGLLGPLENCGPGFRPCEPRLEGR